MGQLAGNIFKDLVIKLTGTYESSEAKSISFLLLDEMFKINRSLVVLNKEVDLSDDQLSELKDYTTRLVNHEPIQHILGKAYFYNRWYKVNSNVLVPRQETEELIPRIVRENKKEHLKVLDIGTGTGVLAISLFHEMKSPEVHAWDISKKALEIAEENAKSLKAEINFRQIDILQEVSNEINFDVIVSNPPYIKQSEKIKMRKNVLMFDPHIALFVPNDNPLQFHSAIARFASGYLNKGGRLYLEINEKLGSDTVDVVNQLDFTRVKIIEDLNGKDRFVSAVKA